MWPRQKPLVREYNLCHSEGLHWKVNPPGGRVNIFTSIQLTMIIILSMHYELNCVIKLDICQKIIHFGYFPLKDFFSSGASCVWTL